MPQPCKEAPPVALRWECLSNLAGDAMFAARLTMRNASGAPIAAGWALYFNTCRRVLADSVGDGFRVEHVNGDLFRLSAPDAGDWQPGATLTLAYRAQFWAISETDAPLGFYLAGAHGEIVDLGDPEIVPFTRPEQRQRHARDGVPPADAAWRYRDNLALRPLPPDRVGRITPSPLSASFEAGRCLLSRHAMVLCGAGLESEAALLQGLLDELPPAFSDDAREVRIQLETGDVAAPGPEAYRLDIGPQAILLRGASAHGVFNGIQTLLQLIGEHGVTPCARVLDAPRFGYRGMMLDVARHFASRGTVLRLIDCMARYKLNRLHLHLTDDEGWRLAIDGLPELTDVGARRGAARMGRALEVDVDCLPPSFGSGADVEASNGSGHYDAADFIAILRYAHARHIEVIPEFNMPGHARAAVQAMRVRHARLRARGDLEGAERYLLSDPDDTSVYESVQIWRDNVICVALPSVDRFIDTVVGHVAALYREAGVPLRTVHTGGDEVPSGVWLGSPRCQALMRERGWTGIGQLHADFIERCRAILARHGAAFAGWEETALGVEQADGAAVAPPRPGMRVYAWNNAWGSGKEDVAYRLANAGYEVVLANAAHLYFDLAYAKEPEEPGYYWAGFVETRSAFAFCPLDMLVEQAVDPVGQPVAPERLAAMERLGSEGRARIAGLQGQLWGENARSRERVEYLAAPRLIALAERAWAPAPGWCALHDPDARAAAMAADWNEFANRLGQRELPRLDRAPLAYGYRLPPPGVVREGDVVRANVALPGLAMHYTLDGSEPHAGSPRYDGPLVPSTRARLLRIASFDTRGRRSRIVTLNLEHPD